MDWSIFFLELLKLIIPSLIVFLTAYYIITSYLESDYNKKMLELKLANQNNLLPLRLQAYERLTIFIERINPSAMILRTHVNGLSAREFHQVLVQDIRAEFDHNVAQQMYVAPQTWTMIKTTKEDTINLINFAYNSLPKEATSVELSKQIFESLATAERNPHEVAITMIRTEVQTLF
ncbi:MAG: hypothetical protein RI934_168 [Bacteroidota bacterium]|jgi:hypothetical protein